MSNDLTHMIAFPSPIPDCDSQSPHLLDLFLSSDAKICSAMLFLPLGNFNHVVVSVYNDFPLNSQWDVPFHHILYDYSCADWHGLCDHLRDVPWEDIFKLFLLLLMNFESGFRLEIMYISLVIYIRPYLLTHLHGF